MPLNILALLFAPLLASAATYECSSEFGQTLPIRKIVLKAGARCEECKEPKAPVPPKLVDVNLSQDWNAEIESAKDQTTRLKRQSFEAEGRQIFLDTRYMKRKGDSFKMEVTCGGEGPCQGAFSGANPKFLSLSSPSFDQRPQSSDTKVEITMGSREYLGLIIRILKKSVPLDHANFIPVSASGELKIFREDPIFVQDVGVDEQLLLVGSVRERLASGEVKFRCARQ